MLLNFANVTSETPRITEKDRNRSAEPILPMAFLPKSRGYFHWFYSLLFPPSLFRGTAMEIAVVECAEGNNVFIADFLA